MIYFLEHDSAGNILHICAHPNLTIVPLVNSIEVAKSDTAVTLAEPVDITADEYATLAADGFKAMREYTYDVTTNTLVKRPA